MSFSNLLNGDDSMTFEVKKIGRPVRGTSLWLGPSGRIRIFRCIGFRGTYRGADNWAISVLWKRRVLRRIRWNGSERHVWIIGVNMEQVLLLNCRISPILDIQKRVKLAGLLYGPNGNFLLHDIIIRVYLQKNILKWSFNIF